MVNMKHNSLLDDIVEAMDSIGLKTSIRQYRRSRCIFIKASPDIGKDILKKIEDTLEKYKGRSEIIRLLISKGYILDTGIETLKIDYGLIWEVYDYPTFTHYLIRIYHLTDKSRVKEDKSWIAVYVDENPDTAWWSGEERVSLN